jgi:hypothetical protein
MPHPCRRFPTVDETQISTGSAVGGSVYFAAVVVAFDTVAGASIAVWVPVAVAAGCGASVIPRRCASDVKTSGDGTSEAVGCAGFIRLFARLIAGIAAQPDMVMRLAKPINGTMLVVTVRRG